jgi:hypothetical protein
VSIIVSEKPVQHKSLQSEDLALEDDDESWNPSSLFDNMQGAENEDSDLASTSSGEENLVQHSPFLQSNPIHGDVVSWNFSSDDSDEDYNPTKPEKEFFPLSPIKKPVHLGPKYQAEVPEFLLLKAAEKERKFLATSQQVGTLVYTPDNNLSIEQGKHHV